MPSLISVNIAVSVAVEQERHRQDGRAAGLEAACFSLCPAAAIFRLTRRTLPHVYVCVCFIQEQSDFSRFSFALQELGKKRLHGCS